MAKIRSRGVSRRPKSVLGSPSVVITWLDAQVMGQADGLDDLVGAVDVRTGWVEQVRMGTNAGQRNAGRGGHVADLARMAVQAGRGREPVLHAQHAAVVVVGQVGIANAQFGHGLKLPGKVAKRFHQGKTADNHDRTPENEIPNTAFIVTEDRKLVLQIRAQAKTHFASLGSPRSSHRRTPASSRVPRKPSGSAINRQTVSWRGSSTRSFTPAPSYSPNGKPAACCRSACEKRCKNAGWTRTRNRRQSR